MGRVERAGYLRAGVHGDVRQSVGRERDDAEGVRARRGTIVYRLLRGKETDLSDTSMSKRRVKLKYLHAHAHVHVHVGKVEVSGDRLTERRAEKRGRR